MLIARGLSPRHKLGQNFLHDHNILGKLVDAAEVSSGDVVLEIGPGTGTLTETLVERGCDVIACELDAGLADLVEERLGEQVTLIRGDCMSKRTLNSDMLDAIDNRPFKLVANLPYQVASPLMVELFTSCKNCEGQFVTIQYEVAQRLLAMVDSEDWGVLSILVQRLADVSLITKAPPTCFWPQPKVVSACVALTPNQNSSDIDDDEFATFVTSLFAKRRKQIGTILGREIALPEDVSQEARPSTLSIEQLERLFKQVTSG